jgi:hypothetical protein
MRILIGCYAILALSRVISLMTHLHRISDSQNQTLFWCLVSISLLAIPYAVYTLRRKAPRVSSNWEAYTFFSLAILGIGLSVYDDHFVNAAMHRVIRYGPTKPLQTPFPRAIFLPRS